MPMTDQELVASIRRSLESHGIDETIAGPTASSVVAQQADRDLVRHLFDDPPRTCLDSRFGRPEEDE